MNLYSEVDPQSSVPTGSTKDAFSPLRWLDVGFGSGLWGTVFGERLNERVVGPLERHGPPVWSEESGPDCLAQRCGAENRDHPLDVVGQDVEAHFG